jgi:hypothetical protein
MILTTYTDINERVEQFIRFNVQGNAQRQALPASAGCLDRLDNHWQTKPPDAESAVGARIPESVGECPHLSGAPNQDRGAIIFPERT